MDAEYYTESEGECELNKLVSKCLEMKPNMRKASTKRPVGRPKKSFKTPNSFCELLDPSFLRPFGNESSDIGYDKPLTEYECQDDIRNIMDNASVEIKHDIGKMSAKLNKLFTVMGSLLDRVEKLEKRDSEYLEQFRSQEKRITELESRIEENDRKSMLNRALLTYENINTASESLKTDVTKFLTLELKLAPLIMNGLTVSSFGRGNHTVLLEFATFEGKRELFRAKKSLYNQDKNKYKSLYVNEFLTKNKAELLRKARSMKKENKFHSAFSFDGRVYVRIHEKDDRMIIQDMTDLEKYS
jgi:hypothetical protein